MYAVKRYTVSQVRERLAEALDEADRGVPVVIERRGVRYSLKPEPAAAPQSRRKSIVEIVDPEVAEGQWTWELGARGLRFKSRRPRR